MIVRAAAHLVVASAALLVGLALPTDVGVRAAAAADACSLVPGAEAEAAVGAEGGDLAGPEVVRPGTCSWHSSQSGCTLRALSVAVSSGAAARRFEALRAASSVWSSAPGLGDAAFFTADELPPGAALFIEHLHVLVGDTLAEVTMAGRIGPDASHDLLNRVGAAVAARLGQSPSSR